MREQSIKRGAIKRGRGAKRGATKMDPRAQRVSSYIRRTQRIEQRVEGRTEREALERGTIERDKRPEGGDNLLVFLIALLCFRSALPVFQYVRKLA
jgi:hypothetical protein